jgi:quercetin dioxygenase-like cupin family protein
LLCLACKNAQKESVSNEKTGYVITTAEMNKIDVGNGEIVYQAEGKNHGMKDVSVVITETQPGGGPPLHQHPTEETHVVLKGKVTYFISDSTFTVTAPFIVKIPANAPHTFINSGDSVLNLIGVFGHDNFGPYKPIGKNPLQQ